MNHVRLVSQPSPAKAATSNTTGVGDLPWGLLFLQVVAVVAELIKNP